jgi:uncharacterized membrane protein YeaQ/YmgE (transglycosylase-associated protein family)
MRYRHTQRAASMLLISVLGVAGAVVGVAVRDQLGGGFWWFQAVMILLIVVGVVGARLTVTVEDETVTAAFGWGWPARRVDVRDVVGAGIVHNSWWYGWGIRKVRRGWMFNNAGRDAVELTLRSGRLFRIGTDEPVELLDAVDRQRRSA